MFPVQRGIRQGCPVSALLFILCTEIMAIKLRNDNRITGFRFGNSKNIKLAQYADDTILFLNNRVEIERALNIINQFGNISGLILNFTKCEGFWLGENKQKEIIEELQGIIEK